MKLVNETTATLRIITQPGQPLAIAQWQGHRLPALIGRSGAVVAALKREGDGATPLGRWRMLYGCYRADRVAAPGGALSWQALQPQDGWCDDPTDPLYNAWVPAGYPASHERLYREDSAYDYLVVLSHNLPAQPGYGSAVFLHVWRTGATHTEGCVALQVEDFQRLAAGFSPATVVEIIAA